MDVLASQEALKQSRGAHRAFRVKEKLPRRSWWRLPAGGSGVKGARRFAVSCDEAKPKPDMQANTAAQLIRPARANPVLPGHVTGGWSTTPGMFSYGWICDYVSAWKSKLSELVFTGNANIDIHIFI
jgi:hypothetical protein